MGHDHHGQKFEAMNNLREDPISQGSLTGHGERYQNHEGRQRKPCEGSHTAKHTCPMNTHRKTHLAGPGAGQKLAQRN